MQSRKQQESFKLKSARKIKRGKTRNTNKQLQNVIPRLIENGNLRNQQNLVLGGEYAAVEALSSLGFKIIDRSKDYSYCTDPVNSENKKILKNKNILTNELINQENEKVDASNYFSDEDDPVFAVDIEKREILNKPKFNSTNDPSVNIKIDLSEFLLGMANVCMPERNGGIIVDSDFIKI